MEQGLGITEDEVERPNQIVKVFVLRPTQHAVLQRCRNERRHLVGSPILAVFLLWQLSIDRVDCNIC